MRAAGLGSGQGFPPGSLLAEITPVVITLNEAANIGRCLANLGWARRIVVVDSGSTDETLAICATDPRVRIYTHAFEGHAAQWNWALRMTDLDTEWVLALDADFMTTPQAVSEIGRVDVDTPFDGFRVGFRYAMWGHVLRSGIYTPVTLLFRRTRGRYVQDGHAQRLVLEGATGQLSARFIHDDRKPLARWLQSQLRYAELEADNAAADNASLKSWLRRRSPFAPVAVAVYCLLVRGGLWEGPAGWAYALQRTLAEALLAIVLLERRRAPDSQP